MSEKQEERLTRMMQRYAGQEETLREQVAVLLMSWINDEKITATAARQRLALSTTAWYQVLAWCGLSPIKTEAIQEKTRLKMSRVVGDHHRLSDDELHEVLSSWALQRWAFSDIRRVTGLSVSALESLLTRFDITLVRRRAKNLHWWRGQYRSIRNIIEIEHSPLSYGVLAYRIGRGQSVRKALKH